MIRALGIPLALVGVALFVWAEVLSPHLVTAMIVAGVAGIFLGSGIALFVATHYKDKV